MLNTKPAGMTWAITDPLVMVSVPWAVVAGYILLPVGMTATRAVNVRTGKRTAGTRMEARVTGCWDGVRMPMATRLDRAMSEMITGNQEGRLSPSLTTYK